MSEKTTYQMPPEPFGPVIDSAGMTWRRGAKSSWKCDDRDFLSRSWHHLVVDRGPLTDAPEPVWPTAPYVWWDGKTWTLGDARVYKTPGGYWHEGNLVSPSPEVRDRARRFAREAVPVAIVPAADWVILRRCVEDEGAVWDAAEDLVAATEALNRETDE